MRDPLAEFNQHETADDSEYRPVGIDFIDQIMGVLSGQENIEDDKDRQIDDHHGLQDFEIPPKGFDHIRQFHQNSLPIRVLKALG